MSIKEKILIVDDDPAMVKLINYQLKQLDYNVVATASSAEDSFKKVESLSPDLVLMDIMLKGSIDGIEAAHRIQNRHNVPVIFLTAHEEEGLLQRAKIVEPFGYIVKPLKEQELRISIEMALYKHSAGKKLKESEQRYRQIIEEAGEVIYTTDPQGNFTYFNHPGLRFTGYTQEELLQMNFKDLVPKTWKKQVRSFYRKQFEERNLETVYEMPILTKTGEEKWIEQTVRLFVEEDWVTGSQSIAHDITDRKRAEEALQKAHNELEAKVKERTADLSKANEELLDSEKRYRDLSEHNMDAIIVHSEGILVYANPAAVKLAHAERVEDLIGKSILGFLHPDYKEVVLERVQNMLEKGKKYSQVEEKYIVLDGSEVDVEVSALPITYQDKLSVLGIIRDITDRKEAEKALQKAHDELEQRVKERTTDLSKANKELKNEIADRKRAEAALRESEERQRSLIEKMNDGFIVTDNKDNITFVNKRTCKIFRCSDESALVGHSAFEFLDKENKQIIRKATRRRKEGISETYEVSFQRLDGTEGILRISASPVMDQKNRFVGTSGVINDLTEAREREKLEASLYTISEAAHNVTNLSAMYKVIHETIKDLMPARNFYLALYDRETDMLTWPYFKDEILESDAAVPRKRGKGITEYVLNSRKSLFINGEEYQSLADAGKIELYGEVPVQWIGAPLRIEKEVIGVLAVQTYSDKVTLTESHRNILEFVSTSIAQAISRKRAQEEIQRKSDDLMLINELNEGINRGDTLQEVLKVLAQKTKRIFHSEGANVFLLSKDKKVLNMQNLSLDSSTVNRLESIIGVKIPSLKIPLNKESVYQFVLNQGKPQVIDDPETIQKLMAEFIGNIAKPGSRTAQAFHKLLPKIYKTLNIKAVVNVPLVYQGEAIGLMEISVAKKFIETDLERLQMLAEQLTVAIVRRQEEKERKDLVLQLQDALEKVKTLSGMIPICAWCHKIRDDEGFWAQVDTYIEEHSEAEFTHGICPDCAEEHLRHKHP